MLHNAENLPYIQAFTPFVLRQHYKGRNQYAALLAIAHSVDARYGPTMLVCTMPADLRDAAPVVLRLEKYISTGREKIGATSLATFENTTGRLRGYEWSAWYSNYHKTRGAAHKDAVRFLAHVLPGYQDFDDVLMLGKARCAEILAQLDWLHDNALEANGYKLDQCRELLKALRLWADRETVPLVV